MKKRVLSLPGSLHSYFWDVDIKRLNPKEKSQYVILRLLEIGNERAVRWLRRNFTQAEIVEAIKKRRGFSPKTASFWSTFLKIPPKEILCLQRPYLKQHKIHWPY